MTYGIRLRSDYRPNSIDHILVFNSHSLNLPTLPLCFFIVVTVASLVNILDTFTDYLGLKEIVKYVGKTRSHKNTSRRELWACFLWCIAWCASTEMNFPLVQVMAWCRQATILI